MGNDETGTDEVRGLPGYPANTAIPSGFALPIPLASAPTDLADPEPVDPWSSTWQDTSWRVGGDPAESTDDAPATDPAHPAATAPAGDLGATADPTDWTDSYEFGG